MRFLLLTKAFLARSSFTVLHAFSPLSCPTKCRRLHFLAGVINDLTDTVNERCRELVKQVVIKADAASPFAVVRQGEKREEKREHCREEKESKGIEGIRWKVRRSKAKVNRFDAK